ncbi:MAG: hypothetical protein HRT81_13600 [Henriciella sp.]|nr:hypothetical protein [Henriciella sp.]
MSATDIASTRETLERATAPLIEVINDPTRTFLHTPTRIRLAELTENILATQLNPAVYSQYRALLAAERNIRDANLWVLTETGKMKRQPVRLGLSDGAFIEVISGLETGQQVVTGIRQPGAGRGGRPGGGRPGAGR